MGTRIRNIDPTGNAREITDSGDYVAFGEEVEVDSQLAERLLEQPDVWARPTTKAAKQASKDARRRPEPSDTAEPGPSPANTNEGEQ